MNEQVVLGADIGGTHITTAFVDLQARAILPATVSRVPVNGHGTADEIISVWASTLQHSAAGLNVADVNIGIAMPGPLDYEKGISKIQNQDKYDALYELNIKELLAKKLQINPAQIRFLNDAACFLQGEVFGGAAKGYCRAIGLTLGTGLGSSRYVNGVAQDAALWCTPFLDGIAEDYLATRWFVKRYQALTGEILGGVRELAELAPTNALAESVFKEYGQTLAAFLANFIAADTPEAVVIGGNIAKASPLFLPHTEEALAARGIKTPLLNAILAEEAALLGAASCWQASSSEALG